MPDGTGDGGSGGSGGSGAGEGPDTDEHEFKIVNMYKSDSLYNYGLLPLVYSARMAAGWLRQGSEVRGVYISA